MISGVQGVVTNHRQKLLADKSALVSLIHNRLRESLVVKKNVCTHRFQNYTEEAAGRKVPRMYYTNFDEHITKEYHVLIRNWPLKKFQSPSDITSATELRVLLRSWQSGTTHFYKMNTRTEIDTWEDRYYSRSSGSGTTADAAHVVGGEVQNNTQEDGSRAGVDSQEQGSGVAGEGASSVGRGIETLGSGTIPTAGGPATSFINNFSVTSENGTVVQMAKKPRKKRSDAGKARGKKRKAIEDEGGEDNDTAT